MENASDVEPTRPTRSGRRRRILSGVALVLACLLILLTTVAIWTHQVALNTGRFTTLIGVAVADPALIDPVSSRISTQVVDALDVEARIEARLPDGAKPLAGALAVAIRDAIDTRLRTALANPRLQAALVGSLSFTHERLLGILRGQSDVISLEGGYVYMDVFPVVGAALTELQAIGLIPPEVQLPDLTAPEAPEVLAQRLETALGVTLPPDFGTIQVMRAERLTTAQTAVRAFDLLVIGLIILTAVVIALALYLARNRRRMLIYLGIGTILAFLLARFAIRSLESALIGGIDDADVANAVRSVLDATLADLRGLTTIVLITTGVLVVLALVWGRREAIAEVTTGVRDDGLETSLRTNRRSVERVGLAVIVLLVAWLALGIEVAILAAVLIGAWTLVVRALSSDDDDEAAGRPPAGAAPEASA